MYIFHSNVNPISYIAQNIVIKVKCRRLVSKFARLLTSLKALDIHQSLLCSQTVMHRGITAS